MFNLSDFIDPDAVPCGTCQGYGISGSPPYVGDCPDCHGQGYIVPAINYSGDYESGDSARITPDPGESENDTTGKLSYGPGDYVYMDTKLALRFHGCGVAFIGSVSNFMGTPQYHIIYRCYDNRWVSGGTITETLIAGRAPFAGVSTYEGFFELNDLLNNDGSINWALVEQYILRNKE